jgi:hypothetical protein
MNKILKTTISFFMAMFFIVIAFGSGDSDKNDKSEKQEVNVDKLTINSTWKGSDVIAGVEFIYELQLKEDKTYSLIGTAGGINLNEKGTFKSVKENEIILLNGEYKDCKFIKEGNSLNWYMDNGDFFMTLN